MNYNTINLEEKFATFSEYWSPKIVAQMNDYHFKLAKLQGDFVWHSHAETDEVFFVVEGELRMDFRERSVILKNGEMLVIPKGVEHKPYAERECKVMLIEPAGTINTGDSGGELTAKDGMWI